MNHPIKILLLGVFLTGCQTEQTMRTSEPSTQEQQTIERLVWVETANAKQDAEMAITKGDTALLALATRGSNLPGIPVEDRETLASRCGTKQLHGTGDMVYNDRHLKLLQQVHRYAEEYNQIMRLVCP